MQFVGVSNITIYELNNKAMLQHCDSLNQIHLTAYAGEKVTA
jgi:hypothetical protein